MGLAPSFLHMYKCKRKDHKDIFSPQFWKRPNKRIMLSSKKFSWRSNNAKKIILDDLIKGILPRDDKEITAVEVWEAAYKYMDKFREVKFDQFKARLCDHRKQVSDMHKQTSRESEAPKHDVHLFPRQLKNTKGELKFCFHPSQQLLREDVQEGKHKEMTTSNLRLTHHEYQEFSKQKFKERVYQEVQYQKFLNHLNARREKYGLMA